MPINEETCTAYTMQELEEELQREQNKEKAFFSFRSTVSLLVVVAAVVSLLTLYVLPVLRVDGSSMEPTYNENDVLLVFKKKDLKPGEKPEAVFGLAEGETVVAAYEYCNLHGLWKAEA